MPPQNEGAVLLSELFLFCVRRALRRNLLSELSFFRGGRALRPRLQGFPCALIILCCRWKSQYVTKILHLAVSPLPGIHQGGAFFISMGL